MTISPALRAAASDRRIRGLARQVLLYLHAEFEHGIYHNIKHWAVADALGSDRNEVGKAIAKLVNQGYIRQGPKRERNITSYLILTVRDPAPFCERKSAA